MPIVATQLASHVKELFAQRNQLFERYFARESQPLAAACRIMSQRFLEGGRLLAFGKGAYATDAAHVSVEFVHPVIVGKRALPALDLSLSFQSSLRVLLRPDDIVMGFGPPEGDSEIAQALSESSARGAMTFGLPGDRCDYSLHTPATDPFVHQELMEILYHTLWETVHVFFEHHALGGDIGEAGFLYPFLGQEEQQTDVILERVTDSIRMKVEEDAKLRHQVAAQQADHIAEAALAMGERVRQGGKLILFGNGGSATDANDFAIDCVAPPPGYTPIPAISLALEPANLTALANDVGIDVVFLRQMAAQARPEDIAVGISTSGGSKNVLLALEEARKRGLLTVALLGYDGGEVVRRKLVDHALVVHSDYIPRIQEVQASGYHTIRELLEQTAYGDR